MEHAGSVAPVPRQRLSLRYRRLWTHVVLVSSLVLGDLLSNVCVAAASDASNIHRWDFWPPLRSAPMVSTYLSARPDGKNAVRQSFGPLNLFALLSGAPSTHSNALFYGNVLLQPLVQAPEELQSPAIQRAFEFASTVLRARQHDLEIHLSKDLIVTKAMVLPLQLTPDNGGSELVVLHEYRDVNGRWSGFKSHVKLGLVFVLSLTDAKFDLEHRVVVTLDHRENAYALLQLTSATRTSVGERKQDAVSTAERAPLRILTFNVWNTNPTVDVYGFEKRYAQYTKRMDYLVSHVVQANAAIIGFQEIRYDAQLGASGQHAQIEYLAQALPSYQYVFQPAMSYVHERDPYLRVEEGPAVFSKHPIVDSDYLLLSRDPNDPNDSHQRVCLRAVVDIPDYGLVDVYVTHLSLSERSREQSVVEIWRYMQQGTGRMQVLLGDLNAEPQSRGMRFLAGETELHGESTDLRDAWRELHDEPKPRSTDPVDRETKFTFPCDNPSKRIDFIFYRGQSRVVESTVVAQAPTPDTAHFPTDVGMLDVKSPVYASDHRAVLAEFELQ